MEAIYREICAELGLEPSVVEQPSRNTAVEVAEFHGDSGSVWAPISATRIWGCRTCLGSSLLLLEQHYADFDRPGLVTEEAISLILRMLDGHGIPVAVTNIYGPQCWSVCFPVPDCEDCRDAPRELSDLTRTFHALSSRSSESDEADTRGRRSVLAADFVAANRAAIGFAAIVSNPYDGGDEPHATLLEGLIRTSTNPTDCEVAGGKGLTTGQALASFLGEGLERYFAADPFPARVTLGLERDLADAIDPIVEFGYPACDSTLGIDAYKPDLLTEWVAGENLMSRKEVLVPANLVFCPYLPRSSDACRFTVTSTTGVAAGANLDDATLQALLELIERDAFWYYARTGQRLAALAVEDLHPYVADALSGLPGRMLLHALPNPFNVAVVHATYVTDEQSATRTARGIGAGNDIREASMRAFIECLQILHSLDLAIEVEAVEDDMRRLWFTGEAVDVLPNFFQDSADSRPPAKMCQEATLPSLIDALSREGIDVYRVVLANSPSFAVIRVVATGMCITDATYFASSNRLSEFARSLPSAPAPRIAYAGPTFM
ncbi:MULTISPECIES: YcaO-like family protein [unclassified Microbacterium]|uniref:YcaO-like family protein n=1 Tax=unclassified Microbacterium TaxID=2609290 RepID=UPI003467CCF3